MNFFQHPNNNAVLGAPPGVSIDECRALPVTRFVDDSGHECVASYWRPDAEELAALNRGEAVVLIVQSVTHPPVIVAVSRTEKG